jgi:serine/threonine-protein kinase
MGEVWKARDTRLDRLVAVKRTTARHIERFEQEARAVAALNHPNICQLYDIGQDYLVLEFVAGRPLEGPVPAQEAVGLAIQIAAALEEAHRRGIIHLDLKPSNIMITEEGSVKLLDFGLATLMLSSDPDATQPVSGLLLGTPGYMAPEQAEAKPVDTRSDVFSFGAVLYELLSGSRAFSGDSILRLLSAVLRDDPPPLQTSPALQRIVTRCLAKDPDERFSTIGEVKAALMRVSTAPEEPGASIAVLPFVNMSPDQENEYFSDGLTEEIQNALAHIAGLRVAARASSFAFRGKQQDLRKIAASLGVRHILEGSVRRSGARIRVTAQLIEPLEGYQIWSERYDRELADVFVVQDEIATSIAAALQVTLSGAARKTRAYTPDVAAHEAFLKGRHHLLRVTPDSLARGRDYFSQAIAIDPDFALPHSHLAWYYFLLAFHGLRSSRDVIPLARSSARRALELDPSLPQARSMLAAVAGLFDYDWADADRLFRLALSAIPVPGEVRWSYSNAYLLPHGRAREAAAEIQKALDHDPLNMVYRNARGVYLYVAGLYDQGINDARQALEIDDRYWGAHFSMGMNYASRMMVSDALREAERAYELAPWTPCTVGLLAGALSQAGNTSRADELMQRLHDHSGQPHWGMVLYHLIRSDIDAAAEWIERAIEQRDLMTIIQIRAPLAQPLRSSAHWPALAGRLNLPVST